MSEPVEQIDQDIRELENTRRILSNLLGLLKESTFIGSKAYQVAEGMTLVQYFHNQTDAAMKARKEERASAKKEAKDAPAA